ncbi:MAG TPA: metal-dependent transcriptional regulator [Anaerolineae bacterium]|nr:metal-dependent transcriptional regulator [Anaerolineae bacterium]HNU04174.1 metal-dependent transcriptional regulator [Anaerolineae bacterium]
MVSKAQQHYLAELYRLQQDSASFVSLSTLAETLDASIQAVSRMVRRLKEYGLVEHELYQGVSLTAEGERQAMPAIRRHRLIEVFLVRVMGFGWDEAHELTDQLELGVNSTLEDRMDALAGYPTRCPHGEPIPSKEGVMPRVDDEPLVNKQPGARLRISRVRTRDAEMLQYIAALGFLPGVELQFVAQAPFGGPLRLACHGQEHIIGRELAAALWVENHQ